MTRRLLIGAALLAMLASPAKAVAPVAAIPPVVMGFNGPGTGGAAFFPFASALAFGAFVIYANAEGIDFPLCGMFKCEYTYPESK